jgi:methionyl-tRNA formyltransferase
LESGTCYAAKISKEEAALNFAQPADVLARKIRAFHPAPGASAMIDGVAIKIWHADVVTRSDLAVAGEIIAADAVAGLVIACGSGALRLTELQKPGGKRLPASEFLKGFPITTGTCATVLAVNGQES